MPTATQTPKFDPVKLREALEQSGMSQGRVARSIGGVGRNAEKNVEYAKAGLPADAIKAATDQINAELDSLKRRRAELSASQPPALADIPDLMSIARSRLATMTLDEQTEVLGLLDIRVTVLEQARCPRVRIEGTVPHAAAGGAP